MDDKQHLMTPPCPPGTLAFSKANRPYLVSMLNAARPIPRAPDALRSP